MLQSLQIWIIYISAGVSAGILGYICIKSYFMLIGNSENLSAPGSNGTLKEYLYPLGLYLGSKADSSEFVANTAKEYDITILQAGGFWGGLNGYEVLAAKLMLPFVLFFFIMFSGLIAGLEMDMALLVSIFFMIFSYMYPNSILNANAKKRKNLFLKQLPGGLDILKVAADSGLDFHSSVNYLVDIYIPGPLKEEMRTFQRELKLGIPSVTALTNIAGRLNIPEASTVFISLAQSIEMGTSIVDMLEITTREMRRKRLLSAEAEAQKAIVKITFPLLLLILPGIFIVLLAPVFKPMMQVFSSLGQ